MSRFSLLAAAAALAVALSACAGQRSDDTTSAAPAAQAQSAAPAPAQPAPTTPPSAATPGTYTDDQLRAFVAASTQIEPISQGLTTATPEQRTAATNQIRTILQTNNITADQYNAIATQARTDAALAARITALRAPADAPTQPQ